MSDVERIRRKVQALRDLEQSPANWSRISYAMNAPIDAGTLARLELDHGIELPADYRSFLTEIGDGGAGPGYGLYSLAAAIAERREGVWGLDDPFEPPSSSADWIEMRAPGMLPIYHDGCSYYGGLVVEGPHRGTMWSYVEIAPGWVPQCGPGLVGPDGDSFEMSGSEPSDYQVWYDAMLLEANRCRWMTFYQVYESWLDSILGSATRAGSA